MNILWVTNTIYPSAAKVIGCKSLHATSWIDAMANSVNRLDDVSLSIFFPGYTNKFIKYVNDNIIFYASANESNMKDDIDYVMEDFKPDIIHMYGTEKRHNLYIIEKYGNIPSVISLQGIISGYINHYFGGMTFRQILKSTSVGFADVFLRRGIFREYYEWKKQIPYERTIIEKAHYFEGRSDWDQAVLRTINRDAIYFSLPRAIRNDFYNFAWDSTSIKSHTIFVHQGDSPRKGVHFVFEAISVLKEVFPDVKLYISGNDPFNKFSYIRGYNKFLYKLINSLNIKSNIVFTGRMTAGEVAERLSKCSLCIIPSSIDNAANSIAEAMIVGTPVLSSFVGGSPYMLGYGEYGYLYAYNEPEMLASKIEYIFNNPDEAIRKSNLGKEIAFERHDITQLTKSLLNIYDEVINDFNSVKSHVT